MKNDEIAKAFRDVINCELCDNSSNQFILRDKTRNTPQPGFVGKNYWNNGILLVAQNPGESKFEDEDKKYAEALCRFGTQGDQSSYQQIHDQLLPFVKKWPVERYFPLKECGLDLDDIAYCNRVRCRTVDNRAPSQKLVKNCASHLLETIDVLKPKVIVFIGKWAYMQSFELLSDRDIKLTCMNRNRSLNTEQRQENRNAVIELIKKHAQPAH